MLAINCLQQSRENHVEIKGNGKMNQIEPKIQNLYVRDTDSVAKIHKIFECKLIMYVNFFRFVFFLCIFLIHNLWITCIKF